MMSSFQCTQCFTITFLVLLCLLSYLIYYNLDTNLTSFNICKVSPQEQESILSLEGNTSLQVLNPNVKDDILILMWFWPFGDKFDLDCSEFDMEECQLTDDRSVYHKAHAVLFHHRDIHGELNNMPEEPRPSFQKWIWFNGESPKNSLQIPKLNNLFNLTSSYRLDSHIPVPYGYLIPVTQEDKSFLLPEKDKLVCWVVSNWNPQHKRVQVYEEMRKHIKIEVYGRAFNSGLNDREFSTVISSCKFYLSFENSVYNDYITEKLFNPMIHGTVPVVLGPSRRNYQDHVPGDSFIHIDDFVSPKELAERLIYLDNNLTEYMKYFKWQERYKVNSFFFGHDHVCRSCLHLKMQKGYQAFHDLNKWYWG